MSKKVLRVIELSQKVWLKPYMDMKTELGKIEKNDFQKHFLSWRTMQFLEKPWKMGENIEISNLQQPKQEEII